MSEWGLKILQIGLGRKVVLLVILGWETLLLLSSATALSQHHSLQLGDCGWLRSSCAVGLCCEFAFSGSLQRLSPKVLARNQTQPCRHLGPCTWAGGLGSSDCIMDMMEGWPPNLGLPQIFFFQKKSQPGVPGMASTYFTCWKLPRCWETHSNTSSLPRRNSQAHQHLPCGEAVAGNKRDKVWLDSRMLAMFPSWGWRWVGNGSYFIPVVKVPCDKNKKKFFCFYRGSDPVDSFQANVVW